jgi:hypothetical protein
LGGVELMRVYGRVGNVGVGMPVWFAATIGLFALMIQFLVFIVILALAVACAIAGTTLYLLGALCGVRDGLAKRESPLAGELRLAGGEAFRAAESVLTWGRTPVQR